VAPYSRIEDSCNTTFWNVASKYVATTIPRDTAQTFGGGRGGAIALTNNHPLGCSVWMLGGSGHNYNDSYLFAHQEAFLIIASGLDATDGLLADSCHIEGARHGVFVQNFGAPHGNLVPAFNRFLFRNAQASFTESLFGMSDDIVELTILNNNISVSFQASTSNYFSDPSRVSFSGLVLGGDGAIGRWADNVPADMTGVVILTGPSAPELFVYNMKAQTDTVIDGELSVNGLVQVGTAVNVSDGTVASVTVTAQGIYSNPDFPSVTIDDPPAGGTTALATVTGMVWFGDNTVIAGGSGYSVGQFFTLVGGTFTTAATGFITAVDGSGVVLSFRGATSGVYSVYPPLGATHTTSGGGGTGLIINAKAWGVHLDTTGVTVTLAGAGYTTFPGVTFSTPLSGHTAARGKVIMGTAIENNAKGINSHALQISTTYANDTAAEAGGVALGEFYRNGSVLQIRVT
jgi:hypothetical protein